MPQRPLSELDGWWVKGSDGKIRGLCFICPLCPDGHSIGVGITGHPEAPSLNSKGNTWKRSDGEGEDLSKATLHPSINCDLPGSICKFHGWVQDGQVRW